jgi:hypothetical protein
MTTALQGDASKPTRRSIVNAVAALVVAVFAVVLLSEVIIVWDPGYFGELGLSLGGLFGGATVNAVIPGSPADKAGIKVGDMVERPPALRDRLVLTGYASAQPGKRVPISIVRASHRRSLTLQARPIAPLSVFDSILFVLHHIALLVFVVVGLVLVLLRPSAMTWGFYLFAFTLVVLFGTGYVTLSYIPAVGFFALVVAWDILVNAGIVGFLIFCLRFPTNVLAGWRRTIDNLAPFLFVGLSVVGIPRDIAAINFAPASVTRTLTHTFDFSALAIWVLGIVILLITYFSARGLERQRIKWVVLGVICAFIAATATSLSSLEQLYAWPNWAELISLLYVILPITVAYAVLRHRVIDVRFVLNRTLAVGTIATIIGLIVIAMDWLFSGRLPSSRFGAVMYTGIALLVGFSLNAARQSINKTVTYIFFRQWRLTQEQADILADAIRRARIKADLYEPLTAGIARAFSLSSAALFERVEDGGFVRVAAVGWRTGTIWHILPDDPLVKRALERPRVVAISLPQRSERDLPTGVARPEVMVPIVAGKNVAAILLLGAHENGTGLDPDELRTIRTLANDAGLVYSSQRPEIQPIAVVMPKVAHS